jgi:beta-alanine--pyruvate transaminase
MTTMNKTSSGIDMSAYWLPFTPNRYFQHHPKIMQSAKGAYYFDDQGRKLFDGLSGLWCSPLGHADPRIGAAIQKQFETMDYCPAFQMASETTFSLAGRIAKMAPEGLDKVFFTNSGSEAVDTALKIAIGYHRVMGNASRTRLIGRDRAYHGVGIAGISVGGMVANRKMFASMMIAAVIMEPVQGSTGVIVPPDGYLQKIREICTKHSILLIFDEVITGFGRLGANFGADRFGVTPDMITFAKGITNGVIPMGGVIVRGDIYDNIIANGGQEQAIEFFHGYTYSGHPIPAAAGHAVLDIFESDDLVNRARALEPVLENGLHALKGKSGILDIRNFGLSGAVELDPVPGKPGLRSMKVLEACIERGALVRVAGDAIAVGPPFISKPEEVEFLCSVLGDAIDEAMKVN